MRLIDVDALCRHLSDWQYGEMTDGKHDTEYGIIENVIEDIQKAPTIDAVPVIRCKDCKHYPVGGDQYEHTLEFPDEMCPCYCEDKWYSWRPRDNWFCANGERKEE